MTKQLKTMLKQKILDNIFETLHGLKTCNLDGINLVKIVRCRIFPKLNNILKYFKVFPKLNNILKCQYG